jgi:glycosyltransferase involved in cell wall biosynthesis
VLALRKSDFGVGLADARRQARDRGIGTVVIHSSDWSREHMPQSLEVAAARLGLPDCRIVDSDGAVQSCLTRPGLMARLAAVPVEVLGGLGLAAVEGVRLRRLCQTTVVDPATVDGPTKGPVLAFWLGPGPNEEVGGAVTHVSGVLGGFRSAGLRVVLVTANEPPAQLSDAIDDFVRVPAMPRRARVTADVTAVASNRFARAVLRSTAARLRPAFIYQRHDVYATAGVEVGRRTGIPVVLEWNSSLVWTRTHWNKLRRLNRLLLPMLTAAESYVAAHSDVVAAVSEHSAQMAIGAGAPPERVVIVPNGVDLRAVDAARAGAQRERSHDIDLIGWVGSFGVWHGAGVLVEAMSMLPSRVHAVMIGDGMERDHCETVAKRLGVWDRIEWTGALSHADAVRRLAECDVLASPHVPLDGRPFFGSPTKLFEYMAIGRPIVASALEQIGDVLEDGRTARLVPPGESAALAAAIEHLLGEPDYARSLGVAARLEAENAHRWEGRAQRVLDQLAAVTKHARIAYEGAAA